MNIFAAESAQDRVAGLDNSRLVKLSDMLNADPAVTATKRQKKGWQCQEYLFLVTRSRVYKTLILCVAAGILYLACLSMSLC